ncbi:MAG TPA: hypothetical protein VNK50_13055 [Calidithermus sp.]|nr:hypothetical protein [Calidithermus sp.]
MFGQGREIARGHQRSGRLPARDELARHFSSPKPPPPPPPPPPPSMEEPDQAAEEQRRRARQRRGRLATILSPTPSVMEPTAPSSTAGHRLLGG